MTNQITWHPMDNHLQHLSSDVNGWTAQVWDYGSHPSRPPHPDGQPFAWFVSPSRTWTDELDRDGYAATLADAQREAERNLREVAAKRVPRDDLLAQFAETMPPGACENWGG